MRVQVPFMALCVTLLRFQDVRATDSCPTLVPGSHQLLSNTSAEVGDPAVIVSCEPGYKLDTNVLTKNVTCVAGVPPYWDLDPGSCIRKECPILSNGTNMQPSTVVSSYYGDDVTFTCEDGFAFDINYTAKGIDRLTTSQAMACEDDPLTVTGRWNRTRGNCSAITCESAPTIKKAFSNGTAGPASPGTSFKYECYAGYLFSGNVFALTITCNSSASWAVDVRESWELGVTALCNRKKEYLGCYEANAVAPDVISSASNPVECVDSCRRSLFHFAAVNGSTCTCGDTLQSTSSSVPKEQCNRYCPGVEPGDTSSQTDVFCGGPDDEQSVFSTLDGCLPTQSIDQTNQLAVANDVTVTCKEGCRGLNFSHAALSSPLCVCVNMTFNPDDIVYQDSCPDNSTVRLHDLALTDVTAGSCEALFHTGVRVHGHYYLKDQAERTFCHFRDGTQCDEGWIGYDGNCYYFEATLKQDFLTALQTCRAADADMVSVLTEQEFTFLKETRQYFSDYSEGDNWFLGAIDAFGSSLFSWTDGSRQTYRHFNKEEPDQYTNLCVVDRNDTYEWYDEELTSKNSFICKKSKHEVGCLEVLPGLTWGFLVDKTKMTLTFCNELCRGQMMDYAYVNGTTCRCNGTPPPHTELNKTECNVPCPGNQYQMCGGPGDVTLSVLKVNTDVAPARSCNELHLIGIGGGIFEVSNGNRMHCEDPECPFAWVSYKSHCYRFIVPHIEAEEARVFCAQKNSYPVVVDTDEEITTLLEIAQNISVYESVSSGWRIGLTALSPLTGPYRWANGHIGNSSLSFWTHETAGGDNLGVIVKNASSLVAQKWTGAASYICERGDDYAGCYNGTTMTSDVNITDYSLMTIQQCVEFCRGHSNAYAYLAPTSCLCSDSLTGVANDDTACTSACSGDPRQTCGGVDVLSVYAVGEYEAFAESCEDLFYASIFVSGQYVVNGSHQECHFLDGTVCPSGWVGYRNECYIYHVRESGKLMSQYCKEYSATLTSVTSMEEFNFLGSYLRGIHYTATDQKVCTGHVDQVELGTMTSMDGLMTNRALVDTGYIRETSIGLEHFGFNADLNISDVGTLASEICKIDRRFKGCFKYNDTLTPTIEDYESMEWTLCKQVCLGQNATIAMVTRTSCYCGQESDLVGLETATSGCTVDCTGFPKQDCGDGTVFLAKAIEDTEAGEDCHTLYLHGVFYQATYKLKNASDPSQYRFETCGFTDLTKCPAGLLGNNGTCVGFFLVNKEKLSAARQQCFRKDSYLLSPSSVPINAFIDTLSTQLPAIPSMGVTQWFTGVTPVYYNTTYLSPHGDMMDRTFVRDSSIPDGTIMYDTVGHDLVESTSSQKRYYACQRTEGHIGCKTVLNIADVALENISDNSVTFCSEFCRGQDARFFGTAGTKCLCFKAVPMTTDATGKCRTECPGAPSQPCGHPASSGDKLSIFDNTYLESKAYSCSDLFRYGIWRPGWYYLQPDSSHGLMKIYCFGHADPYNTIDYDQITFSSSASKSGYDPAMAKLDYPFNTPWIPALSESAAFVKVTFTDTYLVTGLGIQGIHTSTEQAWVSAYSVRYADIALKTVVEYPAFDGGTSFLGNKNGIDVARTYFHRPFVTSEVTINPVSWQADVAVNIEIYGQRFSEFDYDKPYVGCYPKPENIFNVTSQASNLSSCLSSCQLTGRPFAAMDLMSNCSCGSSLGRYGHVEDSLCPEDNEGGNTRRSDGDYIAIYKTYSLHCSAPSQTPVNGTVKKEYHPFTSGVYTVYSTVEYTCSTGYEFKDATNAFNVTCRWEDNEWTSLNKTCQIIHCPAYPDVANGTVAVESTEYQGEATVYCDEGLWATGGGQNQTVSCTANKTWSTVVTCRVRNLQENMKTFHISKMKSRYLSAPMAEHATRSVTDCAAKCLQEFECKGANYRKTSGPVAGNCKLYDDTVVPGDLATDTSWDYLEPND